jgi:hypothetical protein
MEIYNKKIYIIDNINELIIDDRKTVLQIIYNSPSRNKLKEKGSGTQIKIENLPNALIENIYKFVEKKSKEQYLDFV